MQLFSYIQGDHSFTLTDKVTQQMVYLGDDHLYHAHCHEYSSTITIQHSTHQATFSYFLRSPPPPPPSLVDVVLNLFTAGTKQSMTKKTKNKKTKNNNNKKMVGDCSIIKPRRWGLKGSVKHCQKFIMSDTEGMQFARTDSTLFCHVTIQVDIICSM